MLNGFKERLEKELTLLFSNTSLKDWKLLAPSNRQYLSFAGASSLSILKSFNLWITKEEYDETPYQEAPALHRKCQFNQKTI